MAERLICCKHWTAGAIEARPFPCAKMGQGTGRRRHSQEDGRQQGPICVPGPRAERLGQEGHGAQLWHGFPVGFASGFAGASIGASFYAGRLSLMSLTIAGTNSVGTTMTVWPSARKAASCSATCSSSA